MEYEQSVAAINERPSGGPRHNYLRDWIYGGKHGSVTTFALVAGVVGANLSPLVIVIVGFANLVANGFSWAASNFLGAKSEHDDINQLATIECRHIELALEGERERVRQIFAGKGFTGDDLERVVELITSDRERWARTVLAEEYALPQTARSPWLASLNTFSAFGICGLAPLIPFLLNVNRPLRLSILVTGAVFFAIGSARSRWSTVPWWRSGLTTLFVGGFAAGLSYAVGALLKNLVN